MQSCTECGQHFCDDCGKTHIRTYHHSVWCQGSGDGYYCNACDEWPRNQGNAKHSAYCKIAALYFEYKSWINDFKRRAEVAEEELERLQK